ncbi:hypothetical protein C9374_007642 [Naegleria lovaniensis]|uniref:Uncharacterized protein n=1 Tax=Naegleria lovaniensis TaxID=51637 RepID=A0AA88KLK0_NAELO|nr:uncharacterized protein C9374_007642 [Naegleria lovaniensis]KAG2379004.1 hypothetical protein C9374_007642 [Naegleria lovaniensis]
MKKLVISSSAVFRKKSVWELSLPNASHQLPSSSINNFPSSIVDSRMKQLGSSSPVFRQKSILSDLNRTQTQQQKSKSSSDSDQQEQQKKSFSAGQSTSGSKFKKYAIWTAIGLLSTAGWLELNYRSSPEFSTGDYIRKLIYGNPYRNYFNTKNGVILELSVDNNATVADANDVGEGTKKLVYISEEGHIHLIIPDNFVQPGLLANESSAFRDSGKFRLTDITGNDLILEWNRINTVLRTNLQSTMTPTEEVLKACAYKYVESLLERTEGVTIQRTEYIHIPNPKFPKASASRNLPPPLDPMPADLPYKRIATKSGIDMVVVVSSHPVQTDSEKKLWRGDLWFIHFPYVYHFSVNHPEQGMELANFLHNLKLDPSSPQARDVVKQAALQLTNKPEVLEQITNKTFSPERLTQDPEKIAMLVRNDLLRLQHDSFCKFISV